MNSVLRAEIATLTGHAFRIGFAIAGRVSVRTDEWFECDGNTVGANPSSCERVVIAFTKRDDNAEVARHANLPTLRKAVEKWATDGKWSLRLTESPPPMLFCDFIRSANGGT